MMSGSTIETVDLKLDSMIKTLDGIEKRNNEDHAAMKTEQAAITQRLHAIDVQEAEQGKDIKTNAKDIKKHTKRCEKRHTGLNKKLWTFVVTGLLAAAGIVMQFIIGGTP
jgi:hypothetical protein